MHFSHICQFIAIVLTLALWGCNEAVKERPGPWDGLSEIYEITGEGETTPPPDVEDLSIPSGETDRPRTKDFSLKGDGNPYLESIKRQAVRKPLESEEGEGVILNFDNADIYEFIQVIAETLDLNYIIDPQVKGVVNIRSSKEISRNQLYDVFHKVLNINGLDIRREGANYYIFSSRKPMPQTVYGPEQAGRLGESPRMITQIVPIVHLSSSQAIKLIEPSLSEQGIIHDLPSQNTLIISDFESKVVDALIMLSRLDVSPLSSLKVRLVRVEKAPLYDLNDELAEILAALRINRKDHLGVSVQPLERVNSLLLVSNSEAALNSAEEWIRELDVVPSEGRDNIYIYNVRNSVATELAELVISVIEDKPGTSGSPAKAKSKTNGKNSKNLRAPATRLKKKTEGSAGSLKFSGDPLLKANDTRNIILIRALPDDYIEIVKLLERLDNLPRQVLIEVMVAEVLLSDSWDLGIEWAFMNRELDINGSVGYRDTFDFDLTKLAAGPGFSYSFLSSNQRVTALLHTLASQTDLTILSSPQVMVLNNETASVDVGQEVPIVTTETVNDDISSSTNTSVDRTVQYKNTGVILNVTPRINYNGIIILEIDQQVSEAQEENTTSGIDSPLIIKRQIKTKLALKDGETILIGGMIQKKDDTSESGLPYAKNIPLLGWLFKYRSEITRKTELLVMITAHVIESEDVLDRYFRLFKNKMNTFRKELVDK
ncbi:MAG: type II secretion system secretin GspD [Thermodesulfobacteriota bacterium]|nr:type II secretion system secretin GspD [Thermodesulfobacteriota bacterium]